MIGYNIYISNQVLTSLFFLSDYLTKGRRENNMAHEKDMSSKKLEDYTDVFADILNVLLFHKNLLKPELLKSGPTESIYKTDVQTLNDQRRDTLKDYMDESRFLIASIGIENQSTIQKIMPIRIMGYDYGSYRQQLSDNVSFLRPVITIVLNFSMKRWTSGKSLHEILKIPKELKPYVQDYKIYVFDIAFLDDDVINTFTSDFKAVARFFRQKRLNSKEMLYDQTTITHVQEVLEMMSVFANDHTYQDIAPVLLEQQKQKGVTRMCDIAQGFIEKGKAEGEIAGRINTIAEYLTNGGTKENAKKYLNATDDDLLQAEVICKQ